MFCDNHHIWCGASETFDSHYVITLTYGKSKNVNIAMVKTIYGKYELYYFPDEGLSNMWKEGAHVAIFPILNMDYSNTQAVINKLNLITVFS